MRYENIGIVVVSRDSSSQLRALLPRIAAAHATVIVVDNASQDDSVAVAAEAGARVVAMASNTGYAAACNCGTRMLGPNVDWIAFVNPDVTLGSEDLRNLVTDVPEDIWAVSPLTTMADGAPQPDVARPSPTAWFVAGMYLGLTRSKPPAQALLARQAGRHYYSETLSGSCLLVRQACLDLIGGWDDAFFFNCEDDDICVRIRMAGGRVAVDRSVRVRHKKGHSSSTVDIESRRLECARAHATLFHIHGSPWETVLVAVTAYLGCVARRVLVDRVHHLSPHPFAFSTRYRRLWRVLGTTVWSAVVRRPPVRPAPAAFLDP